MSNTQVVVSGFTVDAFLVDCEIVRQRKLELQRKSPADLAKLLGPSALDESLASVRLTELPAQIVEGTETIRDGAPSGPSRKRGERFNENKPLAHVSYEAVAQFIATPKWLREFKSITALAEHLKVSRITVYRRTKNREVLRRAKWLAGEEVMLAAINARRELAEIVEKIAEKAKGGDVPAAKFIREIALDAESRSLTNSGHISPLTINEAMESTEDSGVAPTWKVMQDDERKKRDATRLR